MKNFLRLSLLLLTMVIFSNCSNGSKSNEEEDDAEDAAVGDTSHISVHFAAKKQTVVFPCIEGDTLNIPCPEEADGILTLICQDGAYVVCGDTSHVP